MQSKIGKAVVNYWTWRGDCNRYGRSRLVTTPGPKYLSASTSGQWSHAIA
jgi:hypothetical protein